MSPALSGGFFTESSGKPLPFLSGCLTIVSYCNMVRITVSVLGLTLQIKLQIFNGLHHFCTSKGRILFFPRKRKCAGIQRSFWKEFLLSFSAHMTLCYAFWSLQKIYWHLYKLQLKSILFLIQKTKTLKFKTQEHIQVYPKYSITLLCGKLPNTELCWFNDQVFICLTHSKIQYFLSTLKWILFFYFTLQYCIGFATHEYYF